MKKLFSLSLALLMLAACTREGPQGPPGPRGPQGPAGSGANAEYYIINFSVDPLDWQEFNRPGEVDYQWFIEFNAPEIDQVNFEDAMVVGYLIDQGISYTLPNTVNFGNYIREYSMYYTVGIIGFIVKDSDLQTAPPNAPLDYRVYIANLASKNDAMRDWSQAEWEEFIAGQDPAKVHRINLAAEE